MAFKLCQMVAILVCSVFVMVYSEDTSVIKILVSPDFGTSCPTVYNGVWGIKPNSIINTTEETITEVAISSSECNSNNAIWKIAEDILDKHDGSSCNASDSTVMLSIPRSLGYNDQKKCSDIYLGSASIVRGYMQPSSTMALPSLNMVSRSCVNAFQEIQAPVVVLRRHQNCSHQGGLVVRFFSLADSFINFFGLRNNTFINHFNHEAMKVVKQLENGGNSNDSELFSAFKIVTSLEHDEESLVVDDVVGDWSGFWTSLENYWHIIVRIIKVSIGAMFFIFAIYVYKKVVKATSSSFGWIFEKTPSGGQHQELNTGFPSRGQQPYSSGVTQV